MNRKLLGALGAAATLVASLCAAPPARAAITTVTSPACGQVRVTNSSTAPGEQFIQSDDDAFVSSLTRGHSETFTNIPAGSYMWRSHAWETDTEGHGVVRVDPCNSSWPRRPAEGDQNGDGKADVLGIQAGTGNLYYYRMTSTGLASGIKAGSGWNNMVFMRQVNGLETASYTRGNFLIAVRNDGTVWSYPSKGQGRFGAGRQIGSGFRGYTNFAIAQPNNDLLYGNHLLLASDGANLYAYPLNSSKVDVALSFPLSHDWGPIQKTIAARDFDKDRQVDVLSIDEDGDLGSQPMDWELGARKQVGHGWGAMQTVTSPGSLDGDDLSDLISRRSDGNLYKYLNRGGYWGPATKIGQNWQRIRLLA